jgi:hypothetical protein
MAVLTKDIHDQVVRFVAANRFPFPGQKNWPADSVTLTNETEKRKGFQTPSGFHYPDIIVVGQSGDIREVAEVEIEVGDHLGAKWAMSSAASNYRAKTGMKNFFVYVPQGQEAAARKLLGTKSISYSGLRAYTVDPASSIHIIPIITSDQKEHVESISS